MLGLKRNLPTGTLAVLILISTVKLVRDNNSSALGVELPALILLVSFTFLIRKMRKQKKTSADELFARLLTFWWMLAFLLIGLAYRAEFLILLVGVASIFSLREYFELLKSSRIRREARAILFLSAFGGAVLALYADYTAFVLLNMIVAIFILPVLQVLENRPERSLERLGSLMVGLLLLVLGLGHGLFLIGFGANALVYCVFATELRDLVSYWAGKAISLLESRAPQNPIWRSLNFKIAPLVSPHKAWGAGLISIAVIVLLSIAFQPLFPTIAGVRASAFLMCTLGLTVGFFGLMGDLVFSLIKRSTGVKDSGTLLPGGTGVLDRIDGLVFTLPATYIVMRLWILASTH